MPKSKSCYVRGCPGRTGRQKSMPLSFFNVPAIISETNKKFSGFGQGDRKRKVIELSRERRKAWLKVLKCEDASDSQCIRICARHFISGLPADLEDKDSPDWVPSLNMGYKTNIGKAKSAVRKHEKNKLNAKRSEAVKIYGGTSDYPVFVETGYEEVLIPKTDESSPEEDFIADFEPSTKANDNINENGEILVESAVGDASSAKNTARNEKYGHWHVHFCTKKACLFSKAAAQCYSTEAPDDEDD